MDKEIKALVPFGLGCLLIALLALGFIWGVLAAIKWAVGG